MTFQLCPHLQSISPSISRHSTPVAIAFAIIALSAAAPHLHAQTTTPPAPPMTYTITDLGALPGATSSQGLAINESGDVAGVSIDAEGHSHAVLFRHGKIVDLGLPPDAYASTAYGINGYDEITGELDYPESTVFGFVSHAFLYSADKMQDIGAPPYAGAPSNFDFAVGTAINDSGQIAGAVFARPNFPVGGGQEFLYSAGKFSVIPNFYIAMNYLGPFGKAVGNNINASGQIAGVSNGEAAIYNSSDGSITKIGVGQGSGINDSGDMTGGGPGNNYGFLYSDGAAKSIPPPYAPYPQFTWGLWINASDQIVGRYGTTEEGFGKLALYTPGVGFTPVSALTDSGWSYLEPEAINDKGQITGEGRDPQGEEHAYLLSPVFTKFAALDSVVDLIGTRAHSFFVGGRFALGATSDGIQPLAQTLVLQLGGYHISIPPGSFVKHGRRMYLYRGNIGNVSVYAMLLEVTRNIFLFRVAAEGALGLPSRHPMKLVLTIGDDTGAERIATNYRAGFLREAGVCRVFNLACKKSFRNEGNSGLHGHR